MGQGREPITLVLNRGLGGYPIENHIASFERRPEIMKFNPYITTYQAQDRQMDNFNATQNHTMMYQDLVGNWQTNTGPIFGATEKPTMVPTSAPEVNTSNTTSDVDKTRSSEL